MRPPRRSLTGTNSSSEAASRGPAKRTNTPPSSIQRDSRSCASPATLPTSARMIIGRRCSTHWATASPGAPRSARRMSGNRPAGRPGLGKGYVGKRPERPRQVERRGEQGLCSVGGRAGDDADGAPPPPLVEQRHGTGGTLAADLQAGDVVADLDRKIERRIGLAVARL